MTKKIRMYAGGSISDAVIQLTFNGGKIIRLKNSDMVEVTLAVGTFSVDSGCSAAGGSRMGGRVSGWKGIGLKTIPCKCQIPNSDKQIRFS
jgi:hypothetical protein